MTKLTKYKCDNPACNGGEPIEQSVPAITVVVDSMPDEQTAVRHYCSWACYEMDFGDLAAIDALLGTTNGSGAQFRVRIA